VEEALERPAPPNGGLDFTDMEAEYLNPETPDNVREELKEKVKRIQDLFPQKLSEAETSSN